MEMANSQIAHVWSFSRPSWQAQLFPMHHVNKISYPCGGFTQVPGPEAIPITHKTPGSRYGDPASTNAVFIPDGPCG